MKSPAIPESSVSCRLDVQYACGPAGLPERERFVRWVTAALEGHRQRAELCIRIVDEAEGRVLNAQYRDKDYATNVLSFPADEPMQPDLLGDLMLCAPVIASEAAAQGKALEAHYAHLTVHGVLHLLGYEHESEMEAEAMEALERQILAGFGFSDPYETDTLASGHVKEEADKLP